TQYYAMKGLTNLVKVINAIRLKLNRNLRILGLLPTFYDGRTNLARDMLDELRVVGDHHVFSSIVRNTVKLGEAPLVGRPITTYAGGSEDARPYRELAREVVVLGTALFPSSRRASAFGGTRALPRDRQPAVAGRPDQERRGPDRPGRSHRAESGAATTRVQPGDARRARRIDPRTRCAPTHPRAPQGSEPLPADRRRT